MNDEHDWIEAAKRADPIGAGFLGRLRIEALADCVERGADNHETFKPVVARKTEAANFTLLEAAMQFVAYLIIAKEIYQNIEFVDKVAPVVLDKNRRLQIAEHAVLRLRQLGLHAFADKVEEMIARVLDRITAPDK
ncbi:hypothetical protein [Mesorhizobium sp. M0767]|uniref:hypothetical protein n=1 Tax=Mesorhizobium sp. M0767 TaxID=2956995 RepID=UPI003337016F